MVVPDGGVMVYREIEYVEGEEYNDVDVDSIKSFVKNINDI